MGRRNLANMKTENIVVLCDVDWSYAAKTFNDYPKARQFKDWRMMFDQMGKSIDAIMVATPDPTHVGVVAHAITFGKHTYVQKPHLLNSLYRLTIKKRIVSVYKVFYVIIPPQYAAKGIVPPMYYISQLMEYLDKPYYISLLNAAELHGRYGKSNVFR